MGNIENILSGDKKKMPTVSQTETYKTIMRLYDDAENVIKAAESYGSEFDPFVGTLKKYIETVEKNTATIIDNFLKSVESGRDITNSQKLKIENCVKDINNASKQLLDTINN